MCYLWEGGRTTLRRWINQRLRLHLTHGALQGVRLYTPSGSLGINGTTDWEEHHDVLRLQVHSAQITPNSYSSLFREDVGIQVQWLWRMVGSVNMGQTVFSYCAIGSILVVGGEEGSNGAPVPSIEVSRI